MTGVECAASWQIRSMAPLLRMVLQSEMSSERSSVESTTCASWIRASKATSSVEATVSASQKASKDAPSVAPKDSDIERGRDARLQLEISLAVGLRWWPTRRGVKTAFSVPGACGVRVHAFAPKVRYHLGPCTGHLSISSPSHAISCMNHGRWALTIGVLDMTHVGNSYVTDLIENMRSSLDTDQHNYPKHAQYTDARVHRATFSSVVTALCARRAWARHS